LLIVAFIFGFINVAIRPIAIMLSLPLRFLTLSLSTLVINAVTLLLTSLVAQRIGFHIDGVRAALLGACIISVVSLVVSHVLIERW
jgi:putative membrane protein